MKSELLPSVQAVAEFMPPKKNDIDFLETAVFRKAETDMLKKILSDNKVCIINGETTKSKYGHEIIYRQKFSTVIGLYGGCIFKSVS